MCGRYVLSDWMAVLELLGLALDDSTFAGPSFNVAPTQVMPVLLQRAATAPMAAEPLRWGLIPHWAKDRGFGARCINARSETAHEKPSFRDAFVRRRCVVPATGFYEWRREGKARLPFFIHRPDGLPMLFAGLWSSWTDRATGEIVESFAILTRPSDGALAQLHDRSPHTLDPERARAWVAVDSKAERSRAAAHEILAGAPSPEVALRPVSTVVNNVRNRGAELVAECPGHGV